MKTSTVACLEPKSTSCDTFPSAVSKVFATKPMWTREKDILWALKETGGSHRHICRISWVCEDKLTLALKPLGLCSLETYMAHSERAPVLTSRQRLNIAEKIADALQFLHGRKLCHNDVQPSNIVLGEDLTDDVFLVDFGQACKLSPNGQALATSFNAVDPPLRYAPPEVLGRAPVTRGSEVRYASTITSGSVCRCRRHSGPLDACYDRGCTMRFLSSSLKQLCTSSTN